MADALELIGIGLVYCLIFGTVMGVPLYLVTRVLAPLVQTLLLASWE